MKYYLTEAGLDVSKITPEDWRRLFSRGDTRVPQTRNPIRKPASTAKPKPKPVQKEFTFEEKKRTLLQRFAAWVQPSGPRVKVPRDMTTDQRERAYKRFRRTALGDALGESRMYYITKAGIEFLNEKVTPRTSLRLAHMIATGTNTRGTALDPKAVIRAMRASVKLGIAGDTARAVKAQTR